MHTHARTHTHTHTHTDSFCELLPQAKRKEEDEHLIERVRGEIQEQQRTIMKELVGQLKVSTLNHMYMCAFWYVMYVILIGTIPR